MRVSTESTSAIGRRMTVAVPGADVEKQIESRLTRLIKTVRLPGFRPGRVPRKIVESRYAGQVLQEVAGEVINQSYRDALGQEGLRPAGEPSIEPKNLARGEDLEYTATFDVFPEIPAIDLTGRSIERSVCEISEADVDRTIENIRKGRVEWRESDAAAADGDRVTMDFQGTIDGEPFEGGHAHGYQVVLGAGALIGEFDQELTGVVAGEDRTVTVNFSADYSAPMVAGKQAEFAVHVTGVENPVLPEIDEAFIKSFGVAEGSTEALRAEVRGNLQRELDARVRADLRNQVMQTLLDTYDIALPRALVEEEIDRQVASTQAMQERQGIPPPHAAVERAPLEVEARRCVTLGLILREFIDSNAIKPDAERVRVRVQELAGSYEEPEQFMQWYYSDQNRINQMESAVLEEQVVEKLLEQTDIKDKPGSMQEFMGGGSSAPE